MTEIKFMIHLFTSSGLKPDPHKFRAIKKVPRPKAKQEMQSLLGFVNYLAKVLLQLSEVAKSL